MYREHNYICKELALDPETGQVVTCDHAVCLNCVDNHEGQGCLCDHVPKPEHSASGNSAVPLPPGLGASNEIAHAINKLVDFQGTMRQAVALAMQHGSNRTSTLKTVTMLDFEKGSNQALEDLPRWFADFKRVSEHVSGGRGLA